MKFSVITEFAMGLGVGIKYKVFDACPTKWYLRMALGVCAITLVWGDSTAIRAFGSKGVARC